LAQLPVNPRVGRMMLFGAMFQCMTPVLIIAASLSFKDPFVIPLNKQRVCGSVYGFEYRGAGRERASWVLWNILHKEAGVISEKRLFHCRRRTASDASLLPAQRVTTLLS
jgi:HrpA-like RNA helicase